MHDCFGGDCLSSFSLLVHGGNARWRLHGVLAAYLLLSRLRRGWLEQLLASLPHLQRHASGVCNFSHYLDDACSWSSEDMTSQKARAQAYLVSCLMYTVPPSHQQLVDLQQFGLRPDERIMRALRVSFDIHLAPPAAANGSLPRYGASSAPVASPAEDPSHLSPARTHFSRSLVKCQTYA